MKFTDLLKYIFLESIDTKLPDNFNTRSVDSCMLAAELITIKLLQQGIQNFIIHEGFIKIKGNDTGKMQHTWIEMNGLKIDETIKQFFPKDVDDTYIKNQTSYIKYKKYSPEEYLTLCQKYPVETDKHYFKK